MTNRHGEVHVVTAELKRRPFSVLEYHRMAEAGILDPDERLELLRGEILTVARPSNGHRGSVNCLTRVLSLLLYDTACVQVRSPIVLSNDSEPVPDVTLLRINDAATGERQVHPGDVFAAIEVADSSHFRDFEVKVPLYAETGIPETWIVDLTTRQVVVFRDLKSGAYSSRIVAHESDRVSFAAFPDLVFDVVEVLGGSLPGSSLSPRHE